MAASTEWPPVELSELLRPTRDAVTVARDETYANLGIYSFGRGVFPKPPIKGDATSAPALYRVRAGQFIYSRLFAFEGAFAVVPPELDEAYVSNEYPAFDVDWTRALADFICAVICQPIVWNELRSRTVGMGHRRQRLHPDALLEYTIPLPPLAEQQRIVDALDAASASIAAAVDEANQAKALLAAARESLMSGFEARPLADLVVKIEAGRSPKALNRPPAPEERGVLKVSAIRAGEFRPAEAKAVAADTRFPSHARVCDGDILVSRANTRALVGATCRVDDSYPNLYLSDKTLRLVVDPETADAAYVVHAIASHMSREHIESNATGTSDSMRNISQASLLETEIPWADEVDRQREVASRLDEIQSALLRAQRAAEDATALRAALADALLSGQRCFRALELPAP